jgi:hypothetical protein
MDWISTRRDHGDIIRFFSYPKKDVRIVHVLKNQAVLMYGEEFTELNTALTFPWDEAEWSLSFILTEPLLYTG